MGYRSGKDGNAFYEIDEDCVRELQKRTEAAKNHQVKSGEGVPGEESKQSKTAENEWMKAIGIFGND